jgi:hypothetical protein
MADEAGPVETTTGPEFAGEIQELIHAVFDKIVSGDGLTVDYASLRDSDEFQDYLVKSQQLAGFEPACLASREGQLTIWINLYNISVIQKVERLEIDKQVLDPGGFFDHNACRVGGFSWSLNDIEYGVLRGNTRRPFRVWRQLRPWDARRRMSLDPPEPRVCFALAQAARSSPPLRFYSPDKVEGQLYQAAVDFISHGGVVIDRDQGTIFLSRLFRIFSPDFGGGQGVMRFIAEHLESPDDAAFILTQVGNARVKFQDFDWSLNGQT